LIETGAPFGVRFPWNFVAKRRGITPHNLEDEIPREAQYYGLHSAYTLGQILFALIALLLIHRGVPFFDEW
jgi:hypothetical protein